MFQLFPVVKGLTVKGYRRYCEKNSVNVECNNKMVRNNVGRRRTNRWFPEDRGQRENMYKVLCQGANMLASGVGPFTIISLLISAPGLRCALNKETDKSCLARLASLTKRTKKGRSNSQLKSKKDFKNADSKSRSQMHNTQTSKYRFQKVHQKIPLVGLVKNR